MFAQYAIFHFCTFNQPMIYLYGWNEFPKHNIYGSFFKIYCINILIGLFRSFSLKIIIDVLGIVSPFYDLFLFHLFHWSTLVITYQNLFQIIPTSVSCQCQYLLLIFHYLNSIFLGFFFYYVQWVILVVFYLGCYLWEYTFYLNIVF